MAEASEDDDKESGFNILRNYVKEFNEKCSELESAVLMTTRKEERVTEEEQTKRIKMLAKALREEGDALDGILLTLARRLKRHLDTERKETAEDDAASHGSSASKRHKQWESLTEMHEALNLMRLRFERSTDFYSVAKTVLVNTVSGVMFPLVGLASGASSELQKRVSELYSLMLDMEHYIDKKRTMYTETDASPGTQFATLAITKESKHETIEPLLQEDENEVLKYRLKIPSGGLFKCRQTDLMFKMETDGELEYYSLPWADRLNNQPWKLAGPLYNINCLQGTLVELYLPHCEISSEKRHTFLRVVHIKDDNMEIMEPKEITETHVVVPSGCLSLFGLITNFFGERSIRALVVLFFQAGSNPLLNALLLASNTDITVVQQTRARRIYPRQETYIDINPDCEINTDKRYTLSTDPVGLSVTPKSARYVECGPNFTSTFTVYCDKVKRVTLTLKDGSKTVWENLVHMEEGQRYKPPELFGADLREGVSEDFFRKHKQALKYRLPVLLGPILDKLADKKVLNTVEREEIQVKGTSFDKNVLLLDMVERKGVYAQIEFCLVLQGMDHFLFIDLARHESEEDSGTPV